MTHPNRVMRRSSCAGARLGAARGCNGGALRPQQAGCGRAASNQDRRPLRRCRSARRHRSPAAPARLWPARGPQEDFTARANIGNGRERFAPPNGAQDVDPRDNGPEVPRCPTDVGDNGVRREAQDAATAIEDLLCNIAAETNPVLDLLLMPDQFDMGERIPMEARCDHGAPRRSFPPSRRWPTSEELDSNTLDSELGEPEVVD